MTAQRGDFRRTARCWCGRPAMPGDLDCAEHDNPPPRRITVPSPGLVASIGLALVVIGVAVGLLLVAFSQRYDVLPSPDGPVVVEEVPA